MTTEAKRKARQKLVLDHFHDEVKQDWDAVLSTFPHPHYELVPTMKVHDGDRTVRDYYRETRVAFPDQHHEIISFRHSDDAVIVEFWLMGTHLGPLGAIPPTGSRFRVRMSAYFIFDEAEKLVCERVYFDTLSMLRQLLGGLDMGSPKNWLLAVRCFKGLLAMSGGTPAPELTETRPPTFTD
ncbi:ester cyclase [Corallococcus carmarthensis]|uniref:Polyketide cyclase n=1 Tax=Corallococcus carmarthensis TaxID=2316728 RepID=A0A3A8JYX9_9BACT|nr:ester cyclase [Corallococcus carmarthensis]NOK15897.1 SnoaL-like domain-containing protein [Corallococcus carmarthensis]RKG97424.1 polyketide cyclase [Corallococcus carmarthensis]